MIPTSPMAFYLASRSIDLARLPSNIGEALRFHSACPFRLDDGSTARLPAMVALLRDIITNVSTGIHRTALKADGSGKADMPGLGNPRKMLGRAKGAVVKLSPDAEITSGLGIAEGIETALSVLSAGWAPVWACGSAGTIADFPVLPGIASLTVFADADQIGIKAAMACQTRWISDGRECRVIRPRTDGQDWNNVTQGKAA